MAAADLVIELRAGAETSVAATKSYLATLAALARLVAAWTQERDARRRRSTRCRTLMDQSWALDWSAALPLLESAAQSVCGGPRLGLGRRAGDRAQVQGDLRSARRGFQQRGAASTVPMPCSATGFPALLLAQHDALARGVEALAIGARPAAGCRCCWPARSAGPARRCCRTIAGRRLNSRRSSCVQSAYRLIATLAVRRGFDPDHPAAPAQGHGDGVVRTALVNGRLLTGEGIVSGRTLLLNGGRIEALVAAAGSALPRRGQRGS